MSTFTTPLKDVIARNNGKIGLDNYPIFDEAYREVLNKKIIRRYWNREIGHETESIFIFQMETKMGEIMPLYNEHYRLGLLAADPLSTISIRSLSEMDSTATNKGVSESESGSDAKSRAVASDTPQTQLAEDQDYATALQDNTSNTTATSTAQEDSTGAQTATSDNTTTGYQGHAPELILRARQALVNVDVMVINELSELFYLLWHNDDEFTRDRRPYYFGSRY